MAVANEKYHFVFLGEPRTASRAVRDALLTLADSYEAGFHHLGMKELLSRGDLRWRQRSKYATFSTVRNPADILATMWILLSKPSGETFEQYIRREGDSRPVNFFFRHALGADYILRYETLQEELDSILHRLICPTVKLKVVGRTEGKEPWFRYYSENDLHYILSHYPEITQYGYTDAIKRQIIAKRLDKASI